MTTPREQVLIDALNEILDERFGYDGDCGVHAIAEKALAEFEQMAQEPVELQSALKFADSLISDAFEGCNFDGGDIQDIAVSYGLLKEIKRESPCGTACMCVENGVDFPSTCYSKTYMDALQAIERKA